MSTHDHEDKDGSSTDDLLLDQPRTNKELDGDQSFGFASMQGWRKSYEDSHKHLIPLDDNLWQYWVYFSIFDGHNGTDTAKNAARFLDKYLLDALNEMTDGYYEPVRSSQLDLHRLHQVIKSTFFLLDKNLGHINRDSSGAVSVVTLIGPERIFLINVGDSRAIVVSKDGHVLTSTKDHKPDDREEQERISKAGGKITHPPNDVLRVEDQLAMTRTLGDFAIDKHIIPALPDIIEYQRDSLAAFVILACDGIWDVMTNEQVALFVTQRASNTKLNNIAAELLDYCLQKESTDNMSVYIIKLD